MTSPPKDFEPSPSPEEEPDVSESDFANFVDHQIDRLIKSERSKTPDLSTLEELKVAVGFCKRFLSDGDSDHEKRAQVMAKLVDLKLEQDQIEEQIQRGEFVEPIKKHRGHEFALQSSSGRNPYCEICVSTIWRISQQWRKCKVCGVRTHDKCINEVKRPCAGLKTRRDNFKLNLSLCPESGLMAQSYKCVECMRPIGFGKGPEQEPRICDYTGKYYCKKCHWNDEMVIPARVVRNWDCTKRPVCRASKQLLSLVEQKPIISLNRDNPALFKYVNALQRMQKLRSSIMFMKCYFVCCRQARKLRILQHLHKYQHFVESEDMYSLTDLVQIATGNIVHEVEQVVEIFKTHITHDCEICKGNAFICELCEDDHLIFPFNEGVSICKTCYACFHKPCFDRRSKRCTRCQRRRSRKAVVTVEEDETEEELSEEGQHIITNANASTVSLQGSVMEEKGIEIQMDKSAENEVIPMSLAEEMKEMVLESESSC